MTQFDTSTLPAGVTLGEGDGGLPGVRVETDAATAQVYLQGAHVTSWIPAGAQDVLWMSPTATFAAGTAIRGGIPLCGPWFGPGRKKDKAQAHGWFRTATWTLADAQADGSDVVLRFTLSGADADVPEGEPTDVTAEYTVRIGSTLVLELQVAAGAEPIELEEAMHTYFAVGGVAAIRIEGLDGTRYADKAPGGLSLNAQAGDLTLVRLTDRVYASEGQVVVVDEGLGRRLVVDKEGSRSTVVWNPWDAKAAEMPDIADAWSSFVCVEAGNVLNQHVKLAPGAAHTMGATISVESL